MSREVSTARLASRIPPLCFSFSDGGIIDNKPLGLALAYLPHLPADEQDERFLILVEPNPAFPPALMPDMKQIIASFTECPSQKGQNNFQSRPLSLLAQVLQILISRNEDVAKDFLTAHKIVHRISTREEILNAIQILLKLIPDPTLMTPSQLENWQKLQNHLLSFLLKEDEFSWENRGESGEKIKTKIKDLWDYLKSLPTQELFRLALEKITDTEKLSPFHIFRIAPENPKPELASDFFGHFGGFFDEKFREHDFELGRYYAAQFMKKHLLPQWHFGEKPRQPTNPDWKDLPWQKRVDIQKRFFSALMGMIPSPFMRLAGKMFFHFSFPIRAPLLHLPTPISLFWHLLFLILLIPNLLFLNFFVILSLLSLPFFWLKKSRSGS